jgi:hypothetical protein
MEAVMPESIPIRHGWRFQDLTGQTFGRLRVIEYAGVSKPGHSTIWLCECSCSGKRSNFLATRLKSGRTVSCGCFRAELSSKRLRRHGQTETVEFGAWENVKSRCGNANTPNFQKYGAKGVRMCQGWMSSFESFLADMGKRPSPKHSIDRVRTLDGYDCGHCDDCLTRGVKANCRWATSKEQCRNKTNNHTLTFNGETKLLIEWSETTGLHSGTILKRLRLGWTEAEALTAPLRGGRTRA